MPNNPIQVVLNADQFRGARETQTPAGSRDFFAGHNAAFVAHREELRAQAAAMSATLSASSYGGVGYAAVAMRPAAVAKSHRPLEKLFTPTRAPVVGSNALGEMIVEVTPEALAEIGETMGRAEEVVVEREDTNGEMKARPSRYRSEVGAIAQLALWEAGDRREFSAAEAVEWLADPRTGGAYLVELFDAPGSVTSPVRSGPRKEAGWRTFAAGLRALGAGLRATRVASHPTPLLEIRLDTSEHEPVVILDADRTRPIVGRPAPFSTSLARHQALLSFLDAHPLVRNIELGPKLEQTHTTVAPSVAASATRAAVLPARGAGPYPIVGVIDGSLGPSLGEWVRDSFCTLAEEDFRPEHGTFIGGLLVAASTLNPTPGNASLGAWEPDGCDLVDLALFPDRAAFAQYYGTPLNFFAEVDHAIAKVRETTPVRVFNFSINADAVARPTRYSFLATQLDRIADKHDVIFVVSAGNLSESDHRAEWVADRAAALTSLSVHRDDALKVPAESARNVSVAAVNPHGHPTCVPLAPAAYSRRGPGLAAGVKPDFAHVGGTCCDADRHGHGLTSVAPDGSVYTSAGTSYAAPHVAKTLARLDVSIEGDVPRETLLALLYHHATPPATIAHRDFVGVARDLVGHGIPSVADDMLQTPDHAVTLLFHSRIVERSELTFKFAWPTALVGPDGECRGDVRLTVVATPPLNAAFKGELARANIHAVLGQEDAGGTFASRLGDALSANSPGRTPAELKRIKDGLKWSPVKTYAARMRGKGRGSTWQLRVKYLLRELARMPDDGVPFTAILTIADPKGEAPVFQQMRQSLLAAGVSLADIRTYTRVAARI